MITWKSARKSARRRYKLLMRVWPEIHVMAFIKTKSVSKSLNRWATEVLGQAVHVESCHCFSYV